MALGNPYLGPISHKTSRSINPQPDIYRSSNSVYSTRKDQ